MPTCIMIVDDAHNVRKLFEAILTRQGWQVLAYAYDHVNLALVEETAPDLIILDFSIHSEGEAWNFLQLLHMEDKTATIPVLVCTTSLTLSPEVAGYLATRRITVIHKPFDSSDLLLKIAQILDTARYSAPIDEVALPILVVDDNEFMRDVLGTVLRLEGYLVVTAANGQLALEAATRLRHGLIILDRELPVMSGSEFLTAYAHSPPPHSPVLISSGSPRQMFEAWPPFVVGELAKPFAMADLLKLVKQYVRPAWRLSGV